MSAFVRRNDSQPKHLGYRNWVWGMQFTNKELDMMSRALERALCALPGKPRPDITTMDIAEVIIQQAARRPVRRNPGERRPPVGVNRQTNASGSAHWNVPLTK
jgi:hypothetical protein